MRIAFVAALILPLVACQGGAQQTGIDIAQDSAVGIQRNLSVAEIDALKRVCTTAIPVAQAAMDPSAPKSVSDVAVYPAAFCTQLLSGSLTNPVDHTSMQWLTQVLGYVQTAAKVAGFVLPYVLPLL